MIYVLRSGRCDYPHVIDGRAAESGGSAYPHLRRGGQGYISDPSLNNSRRILTSTFMHKTHVQAEVTVNSLDFSAKCPGAHFQTARSQRHRRKSRAYTALPSLVRYTNRPFSAINDIFKYADDTTLLVPQHTGVELDVEFQNVKAWAAANCLKLNLSKTKEIVFKRPRVQYGHPLKLMLPESRVNARAHAFPVRVITVWNRLPTHVVGLLASSLLSFKNSLKNVDLTYTLFGKI